MIDRSTGKPHALGQRLTLVSSMRLSGLETMALTTKLSLARPAQTVNSFVSVTLVACRLPVLGVANMHAIQFD